jgi:hypothetical protein
MRTCRTVEDDEFHLIAVSNAECLDDGYGRRNLNDGRWTVDPTRRNTQQSRARPSYLPTDDDSRLPNHGFYPLTVDPNYDGPGRHVAIDPINAEADVATGHHLRLG